MLILIWILAQVGAPAVEAPAVAPSAADAPQIERTCLRQLLTLRRVYVDRLSGGETAEQMRDMIINGLQNTRLFIVTENQDRADAVLRGSAEDLVFNEQHSSSDGVNAHINAGTGRTGRSAAGAYGGMSVGENESSHSVERRHEASASLRLVNKEGDVIWSTTQESMGGKFRGASAEVAEKITAKLAEDYNRARKMP
jgi:hypothetical protein